MSIPYLFFLAVVLSIWTAMIINVHSHTEAWQRTQIALDNATTVMGQDDTILFNVVQVFNKGMDALVAAHHTAHVCALVPYTAAACKPIDQALERFIPRLSKMTHKLANIAWQASGLHGLFEMAKLNTFPLKIEREKQVPIHAETCVYGFETYLEVDNDKTPVVTIVKASPRRDIEIVKAAEEGVIIPTLVLSSACEVGGRSLKTSKKWNYKLRTGIKVDYEM